MNQKRALAPKFPVRPLRFKEDDYEAVFDKR